MFFRRLTSFLKSHSLRFSIPVAAVLMWITLMGCGDSTSPTQGVVSLSLALSGGGQAAGAQSGLSPLGQDFGDTANNTLSVDAVEFVLREIEFERAGSVIDCDESTDGVDCSDFEMGPILVSLPLDGSVSTQISAVVPAGSYDEIEFDVHKPSDSDSTDSDFLVDNPAFADISIRVAGTFNGVPFVFTSDLNEEQELTLQPPLEVVPGAGPTNVTLAIDINTWFRSSDGLLLDPITGNKGGVNEGLVKDNIRNSIEGFEDDNHDGRGDASSS